MSTLLSTLGTLEGSLAGSHPAVQLLYINLVSLSFLSGGVGCLFRVGAHLHRSLESQVLMDIVASTEKLTHFAVLCGVLAWMVRWVG